MADIFVSYKREDQEQKGRVIPIVRALEAEGFDVFFDVEIPPGSTWETVLQTKINMAKCVIVLWSEASVASDWVKEEAEIAKNAGKIIPVFLDRVNPPFGFGRIEGANLVNWDGDLSNVEWQNLVRAVKSRMGEGSKEKRPEVKSVPMPINRSKKSGGGSKYAIFGILAIILAGGGFFGYQTLNKTGEPDETIPVAETDEASERKEREAFLAAWTNGSKEALLKFAASYPDSRYLSRVKDRLEQLAKEEGAKPTATPTPKPTPLPVPTIRPTFTPVPVPTKIPAPTPTPTVRPTLKPAPNVTLTPVPGRVTENLSVREDCLTYSGNFTYQGNRTGSGASLVDRERGATPLSASGVSGEAEMKQALSITSHYKLTQQCFVDRPNPPLSYWKTAAGDIPAGAMRGEDCTSLSASELSVKLRGGMHYVFSGGVSLARFDDEASAKDAVTIIKKYGATNVCYVGRPDPSMTYLRK